MAKIAPNAKGKRTLITTLKARVLAQQTQAAKANPPIPEQAVARPHPGPTGTATWRDLPLRSPAVKVSSCSSELEPSTSLVFRLHASISSRRSLRGAGLILRRSRIRALAQGISERKNDRSRNPLQSVFLRLRNAWRNVSGQNRAR